MITFKKITYRNFQSVGNVPISIDLNTYGKTLIVGKNGAGKTTFIDAICFGLYNRSFRGVNKPQYVNRFIQKDLLVEIWFNNGKSDYMVRRGIKPNVFEIHKNGKLIDQNSDLGDYQDILEKQILKMNFKTFCQIDVLGSKDYIPFMKLSAASRREVVEDLLDIQIFSTMNSLLKERDRENRYNLGTVMATIDNLEKQIALVEKMKAATIPVSNEKLIADKEDHLKKLKASLFEAQVELEGLIKEVDRTAAQKKATESRHEKYSKLIEGIGKVDKRKKTLGKIIDFYSQGECATCKQKIEADFGAQKIKETNDELATLDRKVAEVRALIEDKYGTINDDIDKDFNAAESAHEAFVECRNKISTIERDISWTKEQIASLRKPPDKKEDDGEKNLGVLNEITAQLEEARAEKERLGKERDLITVMTNLLKDGGIKTNIIRQYVPIINSLINKYLEKFDCFLGFEFDENFNESFKARYMDGYSYYSFSAGERQRIDMAILFAWRDLAKMRNSASSSLLIMDEILDGSFDHDGTDDFMRMIAAVEDAMNIFIISHKADSYFDRFDKVIHFEKKNKFSSIKEEVN